LRHKETAREQKDYSRRHNIFITLKNGNVTYL
jgi:hypothetical protein